MSNPKTAEFVLKGTIPSKKNSRLRTRSGHSIPSKEFTEWQDEAIVEVRRQTRARFHGHVQIELILYFGTLGKADTDNKVTSILDMLTEGVILPDDYWRCVARTVYEASYRPNKPGAFVRITQLPDDFFGEEYLKAVEKLNKRKGR